MGQIQGHLALGGSTMALLANRSDQTLLHSQRKTHRCAVQGRHRLLGSPEKGKRAKNHSEKWAYSLRKGQLRLNIYVQLHDRLLRAFSGILSSEQGSKVQKGYPFPPRQCQSNRLSKFFSLFLIHTGFNNLPSLPEKKTLKKSPPPPVNYSKTYPPWDEKQRGQPYSHCWNIHGKHVI